MSKNDLVVQDYKIIIEGKKEALEGQVINALQSGYKLAGGLAVNVFGEFCQALVKYQYNQG
jgi:hypothetical protein